jgi:AraC family transcriptional regulator
LLRVQLRSDDPSVVPVPGYAHTLVVIHVGRPSRITCTRDGHRHTGVAIHGDIDIVPPGVAGVWEMHEPDTVLLMAVMPKLLEAAAEGLGIDSRRVEIRNRFQMRDQQIEHIGWALKAEMERGYPTGRLYRDSLAMALAARLVSNHSAGARETFAPSGQMGAPRLKRVLSYIEENLGEDLRLEAIANEAGLSASHLKVLFRRSTGMPVHRYVIGRRVERAAHLLKRGELPISQVALETGFAHQSHLAMHMRRILGVSPRNLRNETS